MPLALGDVPVHDRTRGLRAFAIGDARCLYRVVKVDAESQKHRSQDHSEKSLHVEPSSDALQRGWPKMVPGPRSRMGMRLGHDPEKCEAVFRKDHAQSKI